MPGIDRRLAEAARLGLHRGRRAQRRPSGGPDEHEPTRDADPTRCRPSTDALAAVDHAAAPSLTRLHRPTNHPDRATSAVQRLSRMTIRSDRVRTVVDEGRAHERGAGRCGAEPGARLSRAGGAGHSVAGRVRADPARTHGCAGRARPRPGGPGPVHRRLRAGRPVQPRPRCGSWPRWTARSSSTSDGDQDHSRRRAPDARRHHRDRRDRHPAPDRRPGRPPDRRTGDRDLRLDGHHLAVRGRLPAVRRELRTRSCPGPTRRCRPWSATGSGWPRRPPGCPRSRSRTRRPSATSPPWRSGWRWCGGWTWS